MTVAMFGFLILITIDCIDFISFSPQFQLIEKIYPTLKTGFYLISNTSNYINNTPLNVIFFSLFLCLECGRTQSPVIHRHHQKLHIANSILPNIFLPLVKPSILTLACVTEEIVMIFPSFIAVFLVSHVYLTKSRFVSTPGDWAVAGLNTSASLTLSFSSDSAPVPASSVSDFSTGAFP